MSDTPITDAEDISSKWNLPESKYQGMRYCSRLLERRLAAMTAAKNKAVEILNNIYEYGVNKGVLRQQIAELEEVK